MFVNVIYSQTQSSNILQLKNAQSQFHDKELTSQKQRYENKINDLQTDKNKLQNENQSLKQKIAR